MEHIVLDMEWNQPFSLKKTVKNPVMLYGEIIQTGAVRLDGGCNIAEAPPITDSRKGCWLYKLGVGGAPSSPQNQNPAYGKTAGRIFALNTGLYYSLLPVFAVALIEKFGQRRIFHDMNHVDEVLR